MPTVTSRPIPTSFVAHIDSAADALDGYWAPLAAREGFDYSPPAVAAYRAGELPATECATDDDPTAWIGTAFYCFDDQTIVYDADFLATVLDKDGADAATGILAHEWGHHLQSLTATPEYTLQAELQADCYAGTYLSNVSGDPARMGASAAAMASFVAAGNDEYAQSAWFDIAEHGSPGMRWAAFATGALGIDELTLCRGYTDYRPQPPVEVGDYTLAHIPGFETEASEGAMTLRREDVQIYLVPLKAVAGTSAEDLGLAEVNRYVDRIGLQIGSSIYDGEQAGFSGEWAGWSYDATAGGSTYAGVIRVHSASTGAGLLVDAAMKDPPLTMPFDEEEERLVLSVLTAAYGIENFLCAPGQSAEPGTDGYAFSCAIEYPEP